MSDENPKVSVIMPSLDVADYIGQCIESVINQTLKDIEIICIDAGSTDGTLEILEDYSKKDSRITLLNSDKKSYGYQMNRAMDVAKGEYIGIVETDDYIESNMYERLYELADGADVSKGNFFHVSEENKIKKDYGKKNLIREGKPFTIEECPGIIKAHPSIWAGIYRREFLIENNIRFIEEAGGGWVDNPFFYETAFAAEKIMFTYDAFYYYREFNPASSSNNLNDYTLPIRRMLDNLDVFDRYAKKSDDIKKMVYMRAFAYLNNIKRRPYFEENLPEVRPLLHEMMLRIDENYIKSNYPLNLQMEYYRYLSPLKLSDKFTEDEYENLLKENEFLYDTISQLQKDRLKDNGNTKEIKKDSSIKSRLKKIF